MNFFKKATFVVISFCCLAAKGNFCFLKRVIEPRDTFFIKRVFNEGKKYHMVYIDSTHNAAVLEKIIGFNERDSLNIRSFDESINKLKVDLKKFNIDKLSSEWIPVKRLNKKYYLYSPSDKGSKSHKVISDSTFLFETMEGYFPIAIESMKQEDSNTYSSLLKITSILVKIYQLKLIFIL